MSGIPTVVVEMASPDGSSGWIAVTSYVSLEDGIRCSRGRSSEFESCDPGTAAFVLNNHNGTWAIDGFFSALGYGIMVKNARVRFTVAGTQVWQGRVDSFKIAPGDIMGHPRLTVDCTDEFKNYARAAVASYGVERTLQALGTYTSGALYPLAAPPGSVGSSFAAHRDATAAPITVFESSRGDWELSSDGPPFIGSCINLNRDEAAGISGPVLMHPTSFNPGADYALVSAWFKTDNTGTGSYIFYMDRSSGGTGNVAAYLSATTGVLNVTVAGDSAGSVSFTSAIGTLHDDVWHHLVVAFAPTTGTTVTVYLDGSNLGSANSGGTACTISATNRRLAFGGANLSGTDYTFNMKSIAAPYCFVHTSAISGASSGWAAGFRGNAGQGLSTRYSNIGGFVGVTINTVSSSNSAITLAGQVLAGASFLDAMRQISETEHGVFYMSRTGTPTFRGFLSRDSASSVALTASATDDLLGDATLSIDDSTYANTVEASGSGGVAIAQDATLVAADGLEITDRFDCIADVTYLQTVADRRLSLRKHNTARLSKLTVDLLTTPNAIETTTLTLQPLDRVRVSDLDSTMFGATTYDGFVEGWELTVNLDEYSVALDLSPADGIGTYTALYESAYS